MDGPTLMKFFQSSKNFDRVLEKVKILSIGDGRCSAELKVDETHTNPMGGLHGGFTATLVDCLSTYALMAKVGAPGVSVNINVSYLKGAKVNDEVLIDANVIKIGKTLAFMEVEIKNKATSEVLVKGSQTQFLTKTT